MKGTLRDWIYFRHGISIADNQEITDKHFHLLPPSVQSLLAEVEILPALWSSSIVIPLTDNDYGVLVKSTALVWQEIARLLVADWNNAFNIAASKWEEFIAAAFDRQGYDEVTLTPRSGDLGRDVIAVRRGVGCVKVIGSVKAYKRGHLVKHDDVRALLGVLNGERDASKAIITTTSDFAPRIRTDPFIKPYLPTRLELINGADLREWITSLLTKADTQKN